MKPNDPDYMLVHVVDYDPKWPEMFKAEAALVREIIGDNLITIFHIGSTAVPGLKAKPVIDMLPVVRDVALSTALRASSPPRATRLWASSVWRADAISGRAARTARTSCTLTNTTPSTR